MVDGMELHVWPEEPAVAADEVEAAATVERPDGNRWRLWYRLPAAAGSALSSDCDAYALAVVFLAMSLGRPLRIHGRVSPSLLRNLEKFQTVWHAWRPERYAQVELRVDLEAEAVPASKVVAGFSGGVDGAYTVHRHAWGRAGRLNETLSAGLMIQGFDIRLDQTPQFENARRGAEAMLTSLGLHLVPMATNQRELRLDWEDTHGAALASCMTLLKGEYSTGLIAPTWPYDRPVVPWGSNPLTDPMLGSRSFRVVHDDASLSRLGRIRELCGWPEALEHLRVCWEPGLGDRNCCVCRKCMRTILPFLALGRERPPAFERMPRRSEILTMTPVGRDYLPLLIEILQVAGANGQEGAEWYGALRQVVRRSRARLWLRDAGKGLRGLLRPRERGSGTLPPR